jgi:hypothetical protein
VVSQRAVHASMTRAADNLKGLTSLFWRRIGFVRGIDQARDHNGLQTDGGDSSNDIGLE